MQEEMKNKEVKKEIKERKRGEKKKIFTKVARSSPATGFLRIPSCNGKVRAL